jgi:rhodanese-like protein
MSVNRIVSSLCNGVSIGSMLVIVYVVGHQYVASSAAAPSAGSAQQALGSSDIIVKGIGGKVPSPGTPIKVSDVQFGPHQQTVIVALSVDCGLTSAATELYKDLVNSASSGQIGMATIFSEEPSDAREFLHKLGLPDKFLLQQDLHSIGVTATPALLVVDSNGLVRKAWSGRLADVDVEVRRAVGLPLRYETGESASVLLTSDMAGDELAAGVPILDVRARAEFRKGHLQGAVNIPFDELRARAIHELRLERPLIVMCGECRVCEDGDAEQRLASLCNRAYVELRQIGFKQLRVLRSGPQAFPSTLSAEK